MSFTEEKNRVITASTATALKWALFFITAVYVINFLFFGFLIGPNDYDHLSSYYEVAWRFWVSSPGIPHFNPFFCGGRTLGGDPQIPIFNPLTFFVPLLGPTLLIKVELLVQLLLGCYGLNGILRFFAISKLGRLWALFLYATAGGVVARFMVGHFTLGFYLLYPLFFFLSYRLTDALDTRQRNRTLVYYGLLFIYAGLYKPNFFIYGIPPLLFEHLVRAILKRRFSILAYFCGAVALSGLANAVFLLPAWHYFSHFPRQTPDSQLKLIPFYTFLANLVLPLKAVPEKFYGPFYLLRHEYNQFVGPVTLVLAGIGAKYFFDRNQKEKIALLLFALFSLWIGFGTLGEGFSRWFPFYWLHQLWPGFESARVPPRFWFGTFVVITILSAQGIKPMESKKLRAAFFLLGMLPLLLSAAINLSKTATQADQKQTEPPRAYPKTIVWSQGSRERMYPPIRQGKGVIDCVWNVEAWRSPHLREANTLDAQTNIPAVINAQWNNWHQISLSAQETEMHHSRPLTIQLNLNHHPFWRFEGKGGQIQSTQKGTLLTLTAPQGNLQGTLTYTQPYTKLGARISGLSLALFLSFAAWAFRRRR